MHNDSDVYSLLGAEFLNAFDDAVEARKEQDELHRPGFYDPCGDIEEAADKKLYLALVRLVKAIRAI